MQPATIDPTLDLCTRYPLRLGGPRQCGIRSLSDTSTHGQHWESNPRPSDLESNALSTRPHAPTSFSISYLFVLFWLNPLKWASSVHWPSINPLKFSPSSLSKKATIHQVTTMLAITSFAQNLKQRWLRTFFFYAIIIPTLFQMCNYLDFFSSILYLSCQGISI